jgi:hypothetical protein
MAQIARTTAADVTAMYQRKECIAHASACREKAKSDPAQQDYWIDEAVVWLQRATEARHKNAVTDEIHDGRMVPKTAN